MPDRRFKSYTQFWWSGGMRRTRRLPRTLYPADFTNFLTSGASPSKNFWFLSFTFSSPIIEFTWYIRFCRFCGFPYIAMRGLFLFSQWTLQLKQGNGLIKKAQKYHRLKNDVGCIHPQCYQISRKMDYSFTRYACLNFQCRVTQKLVLWRLAPFFCVGSHMVKYECSYMKHKWQPLPHVEWHRKCVALTLLVTFCGTCVARQWPDILINSLVHTIDTSRSHTRKSTTYFLSFLHISSKFP